MAARFLPFGQCPLVEAPAGGPLWAVGVVGVLICRDGMEEGSKDGFPHAFQVPAVAPNGIVVVVCQCLDCCACQFSMALTTKHNTTLLPLCRKFQESRLHSLCHVIHALLLFYLHVRAIHLHLTQPLECLCITIGEDGGVAEAMSFHRPVPQVLSHGHLHATRVACVIHITLIEVPLKPSVKLGGVCPKASLRTGAGLAVERLHWEVQHESSDDIHDAASTVHRLEATCHPRSIIAHGDVNGAVLINGRVKFLVGFADNQCRFV